MGGPHIGTVKDLIDISNLMHVLDHHGAEALGGWRLNEPGLTGSRGDTVAIMHRIADKLDAGRYRSLPIDVKKLTVLIRRHVTNR